MIDFLCSVMQKMAVYCLLIFLVWKCSFSYPANIKLEGVADKIVTSTVIDKSRVGLRVYKPQKCYNGYTLYNVMSKPDRGFEPGPPSVIRAHMGPHYKFCSRSESTMDNQQVGIKLNPIFLIDMDGKVAHQWFVDTSISYGRLSPEGMLLYMTNNFPNKYRFEESGNSGIRELDVESNVKRYIPSYSQHDFRVLENGNLLVEQYERIVDSRLGEAPQFIVRIKIITPTGRIIWSWSPFEHYPDMERLVRKKFDLKTNEYFAGCFLNNTVSMIEDNASGRVDRRFRKGNILFSLPEVNTIGIIEYPSGKVVWAWGPGVLDAQHQPSMLENGNILLIDNGKNRGWSRVLEVNPIKKQIVWEYHAEPKESFFSPIISGVTQLPNGNRLVCEGTANRIFEITQEGEIVWDYIDNLDRKNFIGIMRAHRYSPEYVKPLFSLKKGDILNE